MRVGKMLLAVVMAAFIVCLLLFAEQKKRPLPLMAEQIEAEILELTNRQRELQGKRPLQHLPFLQEIARAHSVKMAQEGKLSHFFPGWPTPEKKLVQAGFFFLANAENVAFSQTNDPSLIHGSFINSIIHRMNILDERMTHVGIGVCRWGNDYYITEEFAALLNPEPVEVVMNRLENELCSWFREKYRSSLTILADARKIAKVLAQQYLMANPLTLIRGKWGKMKVVNIAYHDVGAILGEIEREITGPHYRSFVIGVTWGRSARFPGGAYAVSLLLFE